MGKLEKTEAFEISNLPIWKAEEPMRQFEFAVDALEAISMGAGEDIVTANAIASVQTTLRKLHAELHGILFADVD